MSKEYYVSRNDSDFYVKRPNGDVFVRAANADNAKYICAELNRLLALIPKPKHDPCRKFRKGDNVSPCFWNDRPPTAYDLNEITSHFMPEDGLYTVNKDELPDSTVLVEYKGKIITMQACHLELITPVELQKPYFVGESENSYDIFRKTSNGNHLRSSFWWKHNPTPELIELSKANAKEAAEAECDRLNAEYRKEMGK